MSTDSPNPTPFLRPVEARRAFEEILGQLEEAITAGHLAAGDRLPSERDLAERFQVSRTSVREALRVLESLGIIRVRRGADKGAILLEEPSDAFARVLRFLLVLKHISMEDVVEFRATVEAWAAGELAQARGSQTEVVASLRDLLDKMERGEVDVLEFHELDMEFHAELIRGAGNELAILILDGVRTTIRRIMLRAIFGDDGQWPAVRGALIRDHRGIYEAIERGDSHAASLLVRDHIRRWGRRAIDSEERGYKTPPFSTGDLRG